MKEFQATLSEVRAQLRAALAPDAPATPKKSIEQLHASLLRALVDFGHHPDGTKGQAWAILAERSARHLEEAAGVIEDPGATRTHLNEAETLLRMAIGDMNAQGR